MFYLLNYSRLARLLCFYPSATRQSRVILRSPFSSDELAGQTKLHQHSRLSHWRSAGVSENSTRMSDNSGEPGFMVGEMFQTRTQTPSHETTKNTSPEVWIGEISEIIKSIVQKKMRVVAPERCQGSVVEKSESEMWIEQMGEIVVSICELSRKNNSKPNEISWIGRRGAKCSLCQIYILKQFEFQEIAK